MAQADDAGGALSLLLGVSTWLFCALLGYGILVDDLLPL
jgi:hypothetical protein